MLYTPLRPYAEVNSGSVSKFAATLGAVLRLGDPFMLVAGALVAHAIRFGSLMFVAGLSIALPVGFVLILVQIIMGVIGRSAPALNLFAVGIPATLLAGIILLGIATPVMAEAIAHFLSDALDAARMLARG